MRLPIFERPTKGGKCWYCYVRTSDGRRFQRALHIRADGSRESERAATAAYWHEQARATNGELDREARKSKTLGQALGALAAEQAVDKLTDATKHVSLWAADKLLAHFGADRDVELLTRADLVEYAAAATASREASSVAIELRTLSRALDCIDVKCPRKPKLGKQKSKAQNPLTQAEQRALLMAARKPRRKLVLLVALQLGIRRGEYALFDAVDFERQLIHVAGTKTEDSFRWIPIPDELFEHMQELRARDEWTGWPVYTKSQIFHFIERTSKKAGLGPRSPNDARGGVATRLAAAGVNAALRGAIMGNSERMQEQVYSQPHLLGDELLAGMQKLPRVRPVAFKPDARASANAGQTRNAGPLRVTEVVKTHDKPGSGEG